MGKNLRHYLFAKNRRNPLSRFVASRAHKIHLAAQNFNYDPKKNGELFLLRETAARNPRVIFDVGANTGEWAELALEACPNAAVHAFEIMPETADMLTANAGSNPRLVINRIGLADSEGTVKVHRYSEHTHASILDYSEHGASTVVEVPVTTGDAYCAKHNIQRIDLLKMDVEGAESKVIAGFAGMLRAGKIAAIQFEYGRANILAKFLLKDWYDLLAPLGYRIGKLYPNEIDFKPYELKDEDFIGPNYVAVKE